MASKSGDGDAKLRWPLWLGWTLTGVWCTGWLIGLDRRWDAFLKLKWNEIGDSAAGFAGPLAFLWLVVGYYLQREELALQRKELRDNRAVLTEQKDQIRLQALAVRANEQHARRDTFLRMLEFTRHDLAMRAAHLQANLRSPAFVSFDDAQDYLTNEMNRYFQGDRDIFFRVLPRHFVEKDRSAKDAVHQREKTGQPADSEAEKILRKMRDSDEISVSVSMMIRMYDELVKLASNLDDDGSLKYQLQHSSLGYCCQRIEWRYPEARG